MIEDAQLHGTMNHSRNDSVNLTESFNFADFDNNTDDILFCNLFLGEIVPWSLGVYMSIAVIGVTVNIMLLLAIYKDPLKCFRNPTTYFIANLAVSDLLLSFFNVVEILVSQTEFKSSVCLPGHWEAASTVIASFTYYLTFPSVTVLAVERFIAISLPLWYQVKVTSRLCYMCIAAVWIGNGVFTAIDTAEPNVVLVTGYPSLFYVVTVLIYFLAFISIYRQRSSLATDSTKSVSVRRMMKIRLKRQNRFLTTVLIINVVLTFGLIPILIGIHWTYTMKNTAGTLYQVLFYIMDILFIVNMAVNPFLYVWRLPKYRKTFLIMYCSKN